MRRLLMISVLLTALIGGIPTMLKAQPVSDHRLPPEMNAARAKELKLRHATADVTVHKGRLESVRRKATTGELVAIKLSYGVRGQMWYSGESYRPAYFPAGTMLYVSPKTITTFTVKAKDGGEWTWKVARVTEHGQGFNDFCGNPVKLECASLMSKLYRKVEEVTNNVTSYVFKKVVVHVLAESVRREVVAAAPQVWIGANTGQDFTSIGSTRTFVQGAASAIFAQWGKTTFNVQYCCEDGSIYCPPGDPPGLPGEGPPPDGGTPPNNPPVSDPDPVIGNPPPFDPLPFLVTMNSASGYAGGEFFCLKSIR